MTPQPEVQSMAIGLMTLGMAFILLGLAAVLKAFLMAVGR